MISVGMKDLIGMFAAVLGTNPACFVRHEGPWIKIGPIEELKCGQGRNRTADTRIFSSRMGPGLSNTMCRQLNGIQASKVGVRSLIYPVGSHCGK